MKYLAIALTLFGFALASLPASADVFYTDGCCYSVYVPCCNTCYYDYDDCCW